MTPRDYERLDADLDTRVVRHRETQSTVAMSSGVRPHATPTLRAVQRLNDPADMGTTAGIEQALSMRHAKRVSVWAVLGVLLAVPFLGAVGIAIAARFFN